MTYSEVESIEGFVGNFTATIRKKARYVDAEKCTGCGECYQRCPAKVDSEFDMALGKRKAIYVPFLQAVPNVPVIDVEHCIYFKRGKCRVCEKFCPTNAIDFEQTDELVNRRVGAIVIATGFDIFDVSAYPELSPDDPDVITSLHFERMCDTSGPTGGHIVKPSTGEPAKEVVFIQCVGSRDETKGVPYCSRICCMYTAKHALLLKEHEPDAQGYVFYMDVRAGGKNYEEFVRRVQKEYGAAFIRGRVSKVAREGDKLVVWGVDSVAGVQVKIKADLVVLAAAIVPRADAKKLAADARVADCTAGLNLANQADALLNKAYAEATKPREVVFTLPANVINFDFDKYNIRPDAQAILDKIADAMLANPNAKIIIEGHCDHYGSNDYNMALGERRASAAKNYLVTRGIAADRIQTVSYGEERPVRACTSIPDCEVNRRCEFKTQ